MAHFIDINSTENDNMIKDNYFCIGIRYYYQTIILVEISYYLPVIFL